jgi:hypothetical protein
MMVKAVVCCLLIVLMVSLVVIPVNANYLVQYKVSPLLRPGTYVKYKVLFHSTVQEIDIFFGKNISADAIQALVVFHDYTGKTENRTVYLTVAASGTEGNYDVTTVITYYGDTLLIRPIIAPNLHVNDFLTLDDQMTMTFVVTRVGTDVVQYQFRPTVISVLNNGAVYREYDRQTGILLHYVYGIEADIIETNLWTNPIKQLPAPMAIYETITGYLFMTWQIWALLAVTIVMVIFIRWFKHAFGSTRRVVQDMQAKALLKKVEQSDEMVKDVE